MKSVCVYCGSNFGDRPFLLSLAIGCDRPHIIQQGSVKDRAVLSASNDNIEADRSFWASAVPLAQTLSTPKWTRDC